MIRRHGFLAFCLALVLLAVPTLAPAVDRSEPWDRTPLPKDLPAPWSGLSAQASIQYVTVGSHAEYNYNGHRYVDGWIHNTTGVNVRSVFVFVGWFDAYDELIGVGYAPVACWVLENGGTALFNMRIDPPPGAYSHEFLAIGEDTATPRRFLSTAVKGSGVDSITGQRWYSVEVSNTTPATLVGVSVAGWETIGPPEGGYSLVDGLFPVAEHADALDPGESFTVEVRNFNPVAASSPNALVYAEGFLNPPRIDVYRFYNKRTGTHFYTADESEKNNVIATLGWMYAFEGPAYAAYGLDTVGTTPLYRFYNTRTGTHFYTVDPDEAQDVIDNLGYLYSYEGPGFYVAAVGGSWTHDAFRFYNRRNGVHFYTATEAERNDVISRLGSIFAYEGPAFSVPNR